jgi:hypothetical protein
MFFSLSEFLEEFANFIFKFGDLCNNRYINFYIISRKFIEDFLFENHLYSNYPYKYC